MDMHEVSMLLSLRGVKCIMLNQFQWIPVADNKNFEFDLIDELQKGLPVGDSLNTLRNSTSYLDKIFEKLNVVVYGLSNVTLV
jgi:hypothetical protein